MQTFHARARVDRMGVRMDFDGEGFATEEQLSIVSEVVVPGDIQVSGDGAPYVLMFECQTTGGYPRIGSVLPWKAIAGLGKPHDLVGCGSKAFALLFFLTKRMLFWRFSIWEILDFPIYGLGIRIDFPPGGSPAPPLNHGRRRRSL